MDLSQILQILEQHQAIRKLAPKLMGFFLLLMRLGAEGEGEGATLERLPCTQNLGMFTLDEATRDFWFNHMAVEDSSEFNVLGKLIGLAVYNGVILDIRFPPVFYKKLNPSHTSPLGFQAGLLSAFLHLRNCIFRIDRLLYQALDF